VGSFIFFVERRKKKPPAQKKKGKKRATGHSIVPEGCREIFSRRKGGGTMGENEVSARNRR